MSFLPYHRQSLRIASWFCIPEQGMKYYELLCRGTSFLVDMSSMKINKSQEIKRMEERLPHLKLITCSHVVSPWRFPHLYPHDWLHYVKEEHTINVLYRCIDGVVQERLLLPSNYEPNHHPTGLDLCSFDLHVKKENLNGGFNQNENETLNHNIVNTLIDKWEIIPLQLPSFLNPEKDTSNAKNIDIDKSQNDNISSLNQDQIIGKRQDEQILVAPGYGINIHDNTEEKDKSGIDVQTSSTKTGEKMDKDLFLNEILESDEIEEKEQDQLETVELVELSPSITLEVNPNDEKTSLCINMCSPIVLSDVKLKTIYETSKKDNPHISLDTVISSQYNLPRYFFTTEKNGLDLVEGVCGAPLVEPREGTVRGLIEGMVRNNDETNEGMGGVGALIPWWEIKKVC